MKLNCIIVDDEYLAIEVLKVYCSQLDFLSVEQTFKKPENAVTWLKENRADILFLDIEMPTLNGFEVLNCLEYSPVVILTTAYQHFAVKAFDMEILDYLVKPIEFERFEKAVKRAVEYIAVRKEQVKAENAGHLIIKSDYKLNKVPFADIIYIEGLGEYVKIYTPGKTHITLAAMKDLENSLSQSGFVRIHKSYLISVNKIITYNKTEVKLTGNIKLPVGRVYKDGFIASLK